MKYIKRETIKNLLEQWELGKIDEKYVHSQAETLWEQEDWPNYSKEDPRSIAIEVLSHLDILNAQLIIKEDDFSVRVFNSINSENHFTTLFTEEFEKFDEGCFPKNSGWQGRVKIQKEKDSSNDTIDGISVQGDTMEGFRGQARSAPRPEVRHTETILHYGWVIRIT